MGLSGRQCKEIQFALVSAFPSKASLEQMMLFELDKNLEAIAGGGSLEDIIFKIIQKAEAEGWIEDLIRAGRQTNPGNKLLIVAEKILLKPLSQELTLKSIKEKERLLAIPVTGDEASEVKADYTRLRDWLEVKCFAEADLETARIMLWVVKRDKEGWLREEDIKNFPSRDLCTIDKLWLASSNGKFGFSVQKKIWIDTSGEGKKFKKKAFKRFLKTVEWEEKNIIFDLRANRGHLPLGLYVKVSDNARLQQKWEAIIDIERERDTVCANIPNPRQMGRSKIRICLLLKVVTVALLFYLFYVKVINLSVLLISISVLFIFCFWDTLKEFLEAAFLGFQKFLAELQPHPYFSLFSHSSLVAEEFGNQQK